MAEDDRAERFTQISRVSTAKAIEEQVKRLITRGQLMPGERLPAERAFAERLGVSRSTLREALRSLTEQGVVTPRPGAGWVIQPNQMTVASNLIPYLHLAGVTFEDVAAFLLATEPVAARLAAEHRTAEELEAIERSLDDMTATNAARAFLDADSVFHTLIASASHNVMFSYSTRSIMSLLEGARLAVIEDPEAVRCSQIEHHGIVRAIRRRRGDDAESAMREHLELFTLRARAIGAPGLASFGLSASAREEAR